VGWNISIKVMLMPLAMAAMFFKTGIPFLVYRKAVVSGQGPGAGTLFFTDRAQLSAGTVHRSNSQNLVKTLNASIVA
ncbi:MAG: hypothetical protein WAN29_16505, partial [Candidatus Sulfotelmatobacter sp.]